MITRTRLNIRNSAVCPKKLDCGFVFLSDRDILFHISLSWKLHSISCDVGNCFFILCFFKIFNPLPAKV